MTQTTSTTQKELTENTTPEQIMDWLLAEIDDEATRLQSELNQAEQRDSGMQEYFTGKLAGTEYISKQAHNARRWMDFCRLYNLAETNGN